MNSKVGSVNNFATKFVIMTKVIISRYTKQKDNHGRSIKEKYRELKNKALIIQNNSKQLKMPLEECNCGWNIYYSSIFGVEFPCLHQVGNSKFKECPKPPELVVAPYQSFNMIETKVSDQEQYQESKQIQKKKEFVENENVRINLNPNEKYARSEM